MTTARDIMHSGAECIGENETLAAAARRMRDLGVGALPICAGDKKTIVGIVTDRDIVVKCIAVGREPAQTLAADLVHGTPVTVDASADVEEVLQRMVKHGVRRLPVLEKKRLVGIISEADLARNLPEAKVGEFVGAITSFAPDATM